LDTQNPTLGQLLGYKVGVGIRVGLSFKSRPSLTVHSLHLFV